MSARANVIKLRISVLRIFSLHFILRIYKDPFSLLRKYGGNVRNTEIRDLIALNPACTMYLLPGPEM